MILFTFMMIGLMLMIIFIPKRISNLEMYTTSLFATFFAAFVDIFLDLKWDLYGFFEKGVSWQYAFILIVFYPATNVIFLNFYPYKRKLKNKIFYVLMFSVASLLVEWITLHTEIFYYNGWNIWYSGICYPILYAILVCNLKFIRKLNKNNICSI